MNKIDDVMPARRPRTWSAPLAAVGAAALLLGGMWVAKTEGWRINITGSLPGIVYKISKSPGVGDYVQFCPPWVVPTLPDAAPWEPACQGKIPLIKRVVAVAGDRVVVDAAGVAVNGTRIPDSAPKTSTSSGLALPFAAGGYTLRDGEFWVAGEHPDSFDSRYYGEISAAALDIAQ